MSPPLEREAIFPRLDGIKKNLKKLGELAALSPEGFRAEDPYALAQHHLRLALEGIFHIGSHILSRLPGGRAVEYKEIARKLGDLGVVPHDFAERALVPMAGLRNILVHQYSDLDAARLHTIIRQHRGDIDTFLRHIKTLLQHPDRLGLRVE
ncbi:MAG: DUF86 domain-containing protein [Deltaproteobacteria bacterium]|nr:DUF86 domain-containing protein [Deltaproteobacteria bacterium]